MKINNWVPVLGEGMIIAFAAWMVVFLGHLVAAPHGLYAEIEERYKQSQLALESEHAIVIAERKNNKPNLHIVLYDTALLPWRDNPSDASIGVIAGIANSGAPSVARSFRVTIPRVVIAGTPEAFEGILSTVGSKPWRINIEKFDVNFRSEDSLPEKAIRNPIPTGGEVTGYILVRFPGVPSGKIGALGMGIQIQVEDIEGRVYKRYSKPAPSLGYTPYYPGTRLNDIH
jgi:hypothetical protein